MKNYVQEGESFQYTVPSGGVTGGSVVVSGSLIGVAAVTGAEGDVVTVQRDGVYELAKAAVDIAQGDHLFFDTTNKVVTNVAAAAHVYIGKAFEAAASGAATANVVLLPSTNSQASLTTAKLTTTSLFFSALSTAPANAGATGTLGEIRIVSGFIYVCVATNTWQRAAIATW